MKRKSIDPVLPTAAAGTLRVRRKAVDGQRDLFYLMTLPVDITAGRVWLFSVPF